MPFIARYFNFLLAIFICFLSSIVLIANYYVIQFPSNNYFPPDSGLIASVLFLIWLGTYLLDKESIYQKIARELVYFFLMISVIAFATNAVQLTPFNPIDNQLIKIDSFFGIHLEKILAWVATKPWLITILAFSYDSLPWQMAYLPLVLIFARKFSYLREFYSLMLITTLLGFTFYYFWPTVGPATAIGSPYFTTYQYATGLKFVEIHNHQMPTTNEGGLIAMPSFHMIWALLCLNLSRCLPFIFFLLLPINLLLIASCVLLGWHYFIDLVGGVILLFVAQFIYAHLGDQT